MRPKCSVFLEVDRRGRGTSLARRVVAQPYLARCAAAAVKGLLQSVRSKKRIATLAAAREAELGNHT